MIKENITFLIFVFLFIGCSENSNPKLEDDITCVTVMPSYYNITSNQNLYYPEDLNLNQIKQSEVKFQEIKDTLALGCLRHHDSYRERLEPIESKFVGNLKALRYNDFLSHINNFCKEDDQPFIFAPTDILFETESLVLFSFVRNDALYNAKLETTRIKDFKYPIYSVECNLSFSYPAQENT